MDFFRELSGKRVVTELRLILQEENPVAAIRRLNDFDLLKVIHPSIKLDKVLMATLNSAKEGKIQGAQVAPSLAISNLGMFGVKEFSAIIPPGSLSSRHPPSLGFWLTNQVSAPITRAIAAP